MRPLLLILGRALLPRILRTSDKHSTVRKNVEVSIVCRSQDKPLVSLERRRRADEHYHRLRKVERLVALLDNQKHAECSCLEKDSFLGPDVPQAGDEDVSGRELGRWRPLVRNLQV